MTIEELLAIKPVTFSVNQLMLVTGQGLIATLAENGIKFDTTRSVTIKMLIAAIDTVSPEQQATIKSWSIDTTTDQEANVLNEATSNVMLADSKVVTHVNHVTVWTLCIISLVFVGSISWNIVNNHEYPKVALGLVAIGPITLCALWVIGVLRNRQSLMSVVLGDDTSKESLARTVMKAIVEKK